MADDTPSTPYLPPGNRPLISVVTEYGADRVRGWLASSGWLAIHMDVFALDPKTGREYIVEDVELWNSERAVEVLRTGKLGDLVLFVRNFDWPPDHVFNPPDEREGFPPQSPEPIEPAVAPEKAEDKPAASVEPEPGEKMSAPPSSDDVVTALNEDLAQLAASAADPPELIGLVEMLSKQNEPAESAEPEEATLPEQSEPGTSEPLSRARRSRRGRKPLDVWPDIYNYLASEVTNKGEKYPSYRKAGEAAESWLWQQRTDHAKERKWHRIPNADTIRIRVANERPDLAEDNWD